MKRFSIFCCISLFLNFVNCDTTSTQYSFNINCYEDKSQEINEDLLNKINNLRKEKNVVPLVLEHRLVPGAAEWARQMAENHKFTDNKRDCKYADVGLYDENHYGSYFEAHVHFVETWNEWLTPPNGMLSYLSVPRGQLFWNGTKEIGCGTCSFQGVRDQQVDWVIACRVRPAHYSVFDEEL